MMSFLALFLVSAPFSVSLCLTHTVKAVLVNRTICGRHQVKREHRFVGKSGCHKAEEDKRGLRSVLTVFSEVRSLSECAFIMHT